MSTPRVGLTAEAGRLDALGRYDLDKVAQRELDDLAKLAALLCQAPIALITLLGAQDPWCKAMVGGEARIDQVARSVSFCAAAIAHAPLFIVTDAPNDERFAEHPHVRGEPHVCFYAGAPLLTPEGYALGAIAVVDFTSRQLSGEQQQALALLSRQVMAQFELHRQARELATAEEQRLGTMMQRLTLATDAAAIGIWDWDVVNDEWYASAVYYSMLGYEPAVGPSDRAVWVDRLHPDDRQAVQEKIAGVMAGAVAPYQYEARMRAANGAYHWINVIGRVLERSEGGAPRRLVGVRMDITERKLAELRIQQQNRVHAVLSRINETIVREKDPRTMLSMACRIAVEKGLFRMAWIGLAGAGDAPLEIVAHAGATEDTLRVLELLLAGQQPAARCAFTFRALSTGMHAVCNDIASDAQALPWRAVALQNDYRAMASLPLEAGGKVVGAFNLYADEVGSFDADELRLLDELASDISFALEVQKAESERRRMEQALRESEDRFRQLAENIQEVFWVTDPVNNQVLYLSPAFEKIWQRSCASVYESPRAWLDSIHPDDRARIAHAANTKLGSGDYDETYRILRPDGGERWIHARAYPIRSASGAVSRVVGTAEDITEARLLEEQLRHSQKMEAIGQLAGGVAHDFNNILAAIMMQAELAATVKGQPAEATELLLDIRAATERAANLTRQLLAFSRRQVMQLRLVNLNDVVTSMTKMLQRLLSDDVDLQLELHPDALLTRADAGMLDQVLLNLVVNARDAMPRGGRLVIETAQRTFGPDDGVRSADASPGRYVCLRVRDTGSGIEPQHLPRIFEPFYTTKEPGKGTGLGLATVFGIVKQHGGWLAVASEVGRSATFEVFLRAADAIEHQVNDPVQRRPPSRGETILLVEDEPMVRMLTRVVLERAGYRVLEAPNALVAQRVWEANQHAIRVLMTDIVMPGGVSGRELAARLSAQNPNLRVILTSGYSADLAGRELTVSEGLTFIQKPATPQHLLEAVGRALHGG